MKQEKTLKFKFRVVGGGDEAVGIPSYKSEISIAVTHKDAVLEDAEYAKEFAECLRDALKEFYDTPGVTHITEMEEEK